MTIATLRLRADGVGGEATVRRAAEILRGGGTVAFPTETVYGLGANALDAEAVGKIFAAKQRPGWDPLIVHVDGRAMLERVATVPPGATENAVAALMAAFWPGPLTLLLPRTAEVPDAVTAGRELVGVRSPAHPVARELIRLAGVPVAAPSANRFGHTSPTTAAHVLADLDGRIDAVLDGGAARVGVESTVLDVAQLLIYRPGAVTAQQISDVLGMEVRVVEGDQSMGAASRVSPGLGMRHYAPNAQVALVSGEQAMVAEVRRHAAEDVGVMLPDGWSTGGAGAVFRWGPWNDAEVLARLLFFGLRFLEDRGVRVIVCPLPEKGELAEAIRDRLGKAAKAE
ncbi:MAG: L-threonylcarbamoyladenylate synthase [Acidobacteriaceae bacterium]